MKPHMPLGDFLVAYLRKLGVTHLFGIPGDLVLRLFFRFGQRQGLKIVTFSHEPGVGFAADGYARASGRIGVVCVTYGAGGHNMVNPVAGSFAERVPILVISGGPGDEERKLGTLIHHQAKEIESQHRIYQELTCASSVIADPHAAAAEIDRVVRAMWVHQQPGYIEIHRDIVDRPITVPRSLIEWDGTLAFPKSDEHKLVEAVRDTAVRWNAARNPVLLVGIEAYRYRLTHEVVALAEKLGVATLTSVLAKGAFPMEHRLYMGTYIGKLSPKLIRQRVERADLVLNLGTPFTDMDFGGRTPAIDPRRLISAVDGRVDVSLHTYTDVTLRGFVQHLRQADLRRRRERVCYSDNLSAGPSRRRAPVRVVDLLNEVNRFLRDKPRYLVVAESGDMLFAGLDVRVPGDCAYLAQGYYASMGFGVPGALGAQIATAKRPLILCGDGAFQMTGPEIAQAPRLGCNPIVIVVNNGGWEIFRPVAERPDLLEIPPWPYAELGRAWGGTGFNVETAADLRGALASADTREEFVVIEVAVDPEDHSPISRKYISGSTRRGQVAGQTKGRT
ncbi:MAG: hypothetical protein HY270_07640 [Deltaproteobacteria bacterium]|nr:hypothetical protein [Deltaproteobacteria bacterium]